ncbi:NACHT domain-containing protein [Acinetobacter venetianus]
MEILLSRLEEHLVNFHKELELNYARKTSEVLCKILLKNASISSDEFYDLYGQKLVDKVKPETIKVSKNHTKKIKVELEKVLAYGNFESHDSDDEMDRDTKNEIKETIDKLIKLVFLSESVNFDHKLPNYIFSNYKSKIIDDEEWQCNKIIESVYPNREYSNISSSKEYEFYELIEPDQRKLGFLFFGRNVSLRANILEIVASNGFDKFQSLTILIPNEISKRTGVAVRNKLESLEKISNELIKPVNNNISIKTDYIENYIWDQCLPASFKKPSNIENDPYFVDQALFFDNGDSIFSQELISKISIVREDGDKPTYFIIGSGGAGKTTFCDETIKAIDKITSKGKRKKALMLSSFELPEDIPNNINVHSIQDLYFLLKGDHGGINRSILELNISSGNFILVIDGLDEIVSKLKDRFNINGFFESIDNLNHTYQNSSILITSRDLSYCLDYKSIVGVKILNLKGFDVDLSKKYFEKRFKNKENAFDLEKKSLKYLSELSSGNNTTPLMLALISDLVEDGDDLKINSSSDYFIDENPLDNIVYSLISREIDKQNLEITTDQYFQIIKDIVVEYNGKISNTQLRDLVEITTESTNDDYYKAFYISPLLSKRRSDYHIKYDSLELWFKKRALFSCLRKRKVFDYNCLKVFSTTNAYLGEDLISDFNNLDLDTDFLNENIKFYLKEIIAKERVLDVDMKIISGLLYLFVAKNKINDKCDLSIAIKSLLPIEFDKIKKICIYGSFHPIDFNDIVVSEGYFNRYTNLSNCIFPENKTIFYDSTFINFSADDFSKKSSLNKNHFDNCSLDKGLLEVINKVENTIVNKVENIKHDLKKIFKCGYSEGGFSWKSILVYKQQCNSLKSNIILSEWFEILQKNDFIMKEKAKSSSENGYVVAPEVRLEVKNFLTQSRESKKINSLINSLTR